MTSDIKKAGQIIESYAEDLKRLEVSECEAVDFSADQCKVLVSALGKGAEGEITPDECAQLEKANFSKEFIKEIAGTDGRKALERRAEWLSGHWAKRWYSGFFDDGSGTFGLYDSERAEMISEFSEMKYFEALSVLIKALGDSVLLVRYAAIIGLGKIKDQGAVPVLIVAMGDSEDHVRSLVAYALVEIGSPAVPDLIGAMKSLNPRVRAGVVGVLGRIGAKYGDGIAHVRWAIPDLQRMADVDPDADCRRVAKEILDKLQKKIP